jgi:cell division protein FtsB
MKSKWIIILILIGLLIGLGIMQDTKIIDIKWQWLSILVAAFIAPFKYLYSMLTPNKEKIQAIKDQHEMVRDQEHNYQKELEGRIQEREARIEVLNKEVEVLNSRVRLLEEKSKRVDDMVNNMTVDEKKEKFKELFGE